MHACMYKYIVIECDGAGCTYTYVQYNIFICMHAGPCMDLLDNEELYIYIYSPPHTHTQLAVA